MTPSPSLAGLHQQLGKYLRLGGHPTLEGGIVGSKAGPDGLDCRLNGLPTLFDSGQLLGGLVAQSR